MENLDSIKQLRIVEIRELDREIVEKKRELDGFGDAKGEISRELETLKVYKDKTEKELKELSVSQRRAIKQVEKAGDDSAKLHKENLKVSEEVNREYSKKRKEINDFKDSKKDFIKGLEGREEGLKKREQDIILKLTQASNIKKELEEREVELQDSIKQLKKQQDGMGHERVQIDTMKGEVRRQKVVSEANLQRTDEIKQEKEQGLKRQKELINSLEIKEKALNLKTRTQDRREEDLDQKEAKYTDGYNKLTKAWKEFADREAKLEIRENKLINKK